MKNNTVGLKLKLSGDRDDIKNGHHLIEDGSYLSMLKLDQNLLRKILSGGKKLSYEGFEYYSQFAMRKNLS